MKGLLWGVLGFGALYLFSSRTAIGRGVTAGVGLTGKLRSGVGDIQATVHSVRGTLDDVSGIVHSIQQGFGSLVGSGTSASTNGIAGAYFAGGASGIADASGNDNAGTGDVWTGGYF